MGLRVEVEGGMRDSNYNGVNAVRWERFGCVSRVDRGEGGVGF